MSKKSCVLTIIAVKYDQNRFLTAKPFKPAIW